MAEELMVTLPDGDTMLATLVQQEKANLTCNRCKVKLEYPKGA